MATSDTTSTGHTHGDASERRSPAARAGGREGEDELLTHPCPWFPELLAHCDLPLCCKIDRAQTRRKALLFL